ncbi:MAG TPA: glycosyl transferase [Ruminococcaceae bacterium]|nr:glycosyl transferase [Oscillospiraceae bacterium]
MPTFDNELVSVIMPVYNKERYLEDAVHSVLTQTYPNWELILVDDCSTDRSPLMIEAYRQKDERVRAYCMPQNGGAALARNRALEMAKGRYVAFLDADDLWKPQKLEKQLLKMHQNNWEFTFTAIEMIDAEGELRRSKRQVKDTVNYRFLLSNTIIACSSVIIDRSIVGDFRMPSVRKGQDFATWLSLLRDGRFLAHGIDEVLLQYRIAPGAISSNKAAALARTWRIYREQEHLSLLPACWHFSWYVFHAVKKYWM